MAFFKPKMRIDKMIHITPEMMNSVGAKALLLDIDNTMTTHDNPVPAEGVREWIDRMKSQGFSLMVVSNNNGERVRKFSELLGLAFEGSAKKPLPTGFRRACKRLGIKPVESAVVGDQLFTDVWGARRAGIYTILVNPINPKEEIQIVLKRKLEKMSFRTCAV